MATNEILLSTRYELYPEIITDIVFTKTARLARMREKLRNQSGGAFMSSIFRHTPLAVSAYAPGATHTIEKKQTTDEQQFSLKFMQVTVAEFLEELEVYNRGELAVFSLLDEDLNNAVDSLDTFIAISMYGGGISNPLLINGLDEQCGHGVFPSFNSQVATTVGQQSRAAYPNLNSNVHWFGNSDGSLGTISYKKINRLYAACRDGHYEPSLITCSKVLFHSILELLEDKQRIVDNVIDPFWGASAFQFMKAMVMFDQYCPSLVDGKTDDQNGGLGSTLTSSFANPLTAAAIQAVQGYQNANFPSSDIDGAGTLQVGETLWMDNFDFWELPVSDSEHYSGNLSNFIESQDSEQVVARIKIALNQKCDGGSKYQGQAYGIGV